MKVQFISEPEWAEGKEVTLAPDTYNITGLTEDEFLAVKEAVKERTNHLGYVAPNLRAPTMRVALTFLEDQG